MNDAGHSSGSDTSASVPVFGTSSKVTTRLGWLTIAVGVVFLAYALVISPPEINQADSVRLFYIHVPAAIVSLYLAFGVTAFGSAMVRALDFAL